jgi:hypothetical protein
MDSLFTTAFWTATIQRVIRSFAASLGAVLTAAGTGILHASWLDSLSTAGMAAVLTLLLCVAGGTLTPGGGPAFGTAEVTPATPAPVARNLRGAIGLVEALIILLIIVVILVLFGVIR